MWIIFDLKFLKRGRNCVWTIENMILNMNKNDLDPNEYTHLVSRFTPLNLTKWN